jgi:5-methylcytosine-specific restriction endonuclease McrA
MSRRWPPLVRQSINAVRRPNQSANKRLKWEFQCADCGGWFPRKEVEVDHKVPCGSLRSLQDIAGFIDRLFCEPDGLRVLCEGCHQESHQREGASHK